MRERGSEVIVWLPIIGRGDHIWFIPDYRERLIPSPACGRRWPEKGRMRGIGVREKGSLN